MSILAAVIVLGVLVFVHELGHFILAKRLGIGVTRFSLGFGPKVWGRTVGETEYLISAFPLGGYVKMVGENPGDETPADPARSFQGKPVWARFLVVVAGPIFNLLLAVVLFAGVFMAGIPTLLPVVGQVQEGFPAAEAGIVSGDRIVAIGARTVADWDDMTGIIHESAGHALSIKVRRGSEELTLTITPRSTVTKDIFGESVTVGLIGIGPKGDTERRSVGPVEAVGLAFTRTVDIIGLTFVGIAKIFQRVVPADTIGGPLMIVQLAGEQAKSGFLSLVFLTAFLSINLGIFNLLPIPILDGGHLLFFLIEAVRGKPLSLRKREIVQQIGLALLLALFLFASYNDVMRIAAKVFAK